MRRWTFRSVVVTIILSVGAVLLPSGCGSTNQTRTVDPNLQENIRRQVEQLEEVRSNIIIGTPRTLDIARNTLQQSSLSTTEKGSEYEYIIERIYHTVYPYLEYFRSQAQPPTGSIYADIFEGVMAGKVSAVSQEQTTFLTSLAAGTTIMNALEQDQLEKAGDISSYLVKINPNSILALFLHGYYLEKRNEYAQAVNLYKNALDRDNSCYPARLGKVRINYRQGNPEAAFPDVDILLQEFPEETEVMRWAIDIYLQSGRLQEADSLLSRAIITYPDTIIFLRKRLELLERQEKFDQASRIARVIEQTVGETPETLLIRVQTLVRQNRDIEALGVAREAMEKYPDYRQLSLYYGRLLIGLDRLEDAYEFYREKLEGSPNDLSVIEALLETTMKLERWDEASLYVEELLMQRESVELYIRGVTIYRRLGMNERALEYAATSAEKYPDNPPAVETYLSLLISQGKEGVAEQFIREQQEGRRDSKIRSLLYYFQSRLAENNTQKLQLLQSALLENIRNFSALRDIALLYESLGEYNKALRYLRQALIVRPEDVELQKKLREIEAKRD